jgi:hypothetical protein
MAEKGPNFREVCFPILLLSNYSQVQELLYFPANIDIVSIGKIFQKGKLTRGGKFFTQRPNFSAELAGKVCQASATLVYFALSSWLSLLRDRLIDSEINKLLHGYANRSRPRQSSAHLLSLKVHFSPKYIFS